MLSFRLGRSRTRLTDEATVKAGEGEDEDEALDQEALGAHQIAVLFLFGKGTPVQVHLFS